MDRATRIDLIRECADLLVERHWADIDLVLQEFGLPTFSSWGEDSRSYCITSLREASDTVLGDLHGYLHHERPLEDVGRVAWRAGYFRLFLSHITAEKLFVHEVKAGLTRYGIDSFVAHDDIQPSDEWHNVILAALATADALAAFIHADFHLSHWTDQEVGFAIGRGVPVLGLRFADRDPYGFMGRRQGARCEGLSADAVAWRIYEMLRRSQGTTERLDVGVIQALADSDNYAAANSRCARLGDVGSWTSEKLDALEQALRNSQVNQAKNARPMIDRILRQHRAT